MWCYTLYMLRLRDGVKSERGSTDVPMTWTVLSYCSIDFVAAVCVV